MKNALGENFPSENLAVQKNLNNDEANKNASLIVNKAQQNGFNTKGITPELITSGNPHVILNLMGQAINVILKK